MVNASKISLLMIYNCLCIAPMAHADVLVEIFTASACEVCRNAEDVLRPYTNDPEVKVISYHVDYWDYLGTPDPFANPVFGARQVGYNMAAELKNVSTPQIFVGGLGRFSTTQTSEIRDAIEAAKDFDTVSLSVEPSSGGMMVQFEPMTASVVEFEVILARFYDIDDYQALSGDDKFIAPTMLTVKSLDRLISWDGQSKIKFDVPIDKAKPNLLFVQEKSHGQIVFSKILNDDK